MKQWALSKVKAPEAWEYNTGTKETVVAVIDTGVALQHEDLAEQIWTNKNEIPNNGIDDDNNGFIDDIRGWDFNANDNNNPDDETSQRNPGHGTHCAGIIGAVGNNGIGISGLAHNVSIMPIRFLGANGSGDLMGGAKSDYAIKNKADIISASWGAAVNRAQMKPILEAMQRAKEKGILFIAAVANDGKSNDFREVYPANAGLSNVISVAASDPSDQNHLGQIMDDPRWT